jgi:hypothetical protein
MCGGWCEVNSQRVLGDHVGMGAGLGDGRNAEGMMAAHGPRFSRWRGAIAQLLGCSRRGAEGNRGIGAMRRSMSMCCGCVERRERRLAEAHQIATTTE